MEAATLSSPQRKYTVVPVQKSLSLPSYARAGGEGIDHRLIFAALEQKEKIRRKSRIFAREKTARQNIFCLPISSGAKCRETSLSSDTSCSSLEYQKPKKDDAAKKAAEKQPKDETPVNESTAAKTSQLGSSKTNCHKDAAASRNSETNSSLKVNDVRKGHRSPVDTLKPNVGSSDSMERSSRSSNDSLSRKERLVALKARVEAAREKYGDTSSEDEGNRNSITRYNSDGVIHRTVREVKSRSSRLEKRMRRRSQDEWAVKKANRKHNLSLCLNSNDDGIKLHLEKAQNANDDSQNLECKTDYCPSPNFPDLMKKNYFSDFPSRENVARTVQARIKQIEDEERKRMYGSVNREKGTTASRQSPQNVENSSSFSTERRNRLSGSNALSNLSIEKSSGSTDFTRCASPSPRSSQAPTPPPRSPKSMTFVNKAFIQHQNTPYLSHDNHSLERKLFFQANNPAVSHSRPGERMNSRNEATVNDAKPYSDLVDESAEKRKIRELLNSRRKTCGYFDYAEKDILNNLNLPPGTTETAKSSLMGNSSLLSTDIRGKNIESKGYFSSSEAPCPPSEDPNRKLWRSKWEETERKHEFMFNSLESRKKDVTSSWLKWRGSQRNDETCLCHIITGDKSICTCSRNEPKNVKKASAVPQYKSQLSSYSTNSRNFLSHEMQNSSSRLSKSEANIAFIEQSKSNEPSSAKAEGMYASLRRHDKLPSKDDQKSSNHNDETSATANLESAMEELESVYRSLKFSSDNLSEKTSTSNVSLDEIKTPERKPEVRILKTESDLKIKNSLPENILNTDSYLRRDVKIIHDKKYPEYLNSFINSPSKDPVSCPVSNNSVSKSLCIDELFNDLTRQLDIEQKLLKESRDSRSQLQSPPSYSQIDKCDKFERQKHMSPLESIVSIRKELYDSLQKNNLNQSKDCRPVGEVNTNCDQSQAVLARKKYKAVRSLSANISYLMATANSDSTVSKTSPSKNGDGANCHLETSVIEKSSPKHYEHVVLKPLKVEVKREVALKQPQTSDYSFDADKHKNQKPEEIRHIRVSMDSNVSHSKPIIKNSFPDSREYARLSSAVCRPQTAPKPDVCNRSYRETPAPSSIPKENVDVLDETGLEKLLNTLLNEVPEPKPSSLSLPKEVGPATPPPVAAGKFDHVKYKRNIPKMEAYMASTAKTKVSNAECGQRSLTPEEIAQKVKNDFCQNNAHINQMSFIPVYSKKTMCHNFSKARKDCEIKCNQQEEQSLQRNILATCSPPSRQKCIIDQSERISTRMNQTHMRRRSVGFEDMTSLTSCYGHNFTNDRRFQTVTSNSNIPPASSPMHSNIISSENEFLYGKVSKSENGCISALNQNTQLPSGENENNQICQRNDKPLHRYKDKSSKRKSSLNRMDFIQFSAPNIGNMYYQHDSYQQKSSSSDDDTETKLQQNSELPCSISKRKHNGTNSSPTVLNVFERKVNETTLQSNLASNKIRTNLLPRTTLHNSHTKLWQHRWKQSGTSNFMQKLSHSAGELESLTDFSEIPTGNKACLSAQECDFDCSSRLQYSKITNRIILKNSQKSAANEPKTHSNSLLVKSNSCKDASQVDVKKLCSEVENNPSPRNTNIEDVSEQNSLQNIHSSEVDQPLKEINNVPVEASVKITQPLQANLSPNDVETDSLKVLECDNSKACEVTDVDKSVTKFEQLQISSENNLENIDIYVSAEENSDILSSDGEKRLNSILRKKASEDKKELHSILKPPPDDKLSKTPQSILKHRESSEEKETWQQTDLHSILKKSTSEEESCNSGPDIRPILKVSTDEESPSGSMKPRPILKKRTSFSDECSYASFPSGELKPILKKKTPLSSDEQPKPILKSRRKSEDTRSTMSEFIASRPRAYSADMGVKSNHETRSDGLELKKDFYKQDCNDL